MLRKHSIPVVIALYQGGGTNTLDLIRGVAGHPAAVIKRLRELEQLGVIFRVRPISQRYQILSRLTAKGLQLVETPLNHWKRVFEKWNRPL